MTQHAGKIVHKLTSLMSGRHKCFDLIPVKCLSY